MLRIDFGFVGVLFFVVGVGLLWSCAGFEIALAVVFIACAFFSWELFLKQQEEEENGEA